MSPKISLPTICRHGLNMRSAFDFKKYSLTKWFPGHMSKGYSDIQHKLIGVDCIIEIHDARIPLSGRNNVFSSNLARAKPHMLVFNKVDLLDKRDVKPIIDHYQSCGVQNIIFSNCKNHNDNGIAKILPVVTNLIENSERYHRSSVYEFCILVIGIPNVGKSSLINAMRAKNLGKGKATKVGSKPGITMSVLERIKIKENPNIYILDTPGILSPQIESTEVGLKLALVNTIKENLVDKDAIADYLLYMLNYEGNHRYVDMLNINEPTDDIQKLLIETSIRNDYTLKIRRYKASGGYDVVPDLSRAAVKFINIYRAGDFGPLHLDPVRRNE